MQTEAAAAPTGASSDAAVRSASPGTIKFASLIGTTIEFYDFYIYAAAAVLVFPKLFFPGADQTAAMLQSFATFALAFFARPVGAAVFGHFGDRVGRKATLVAALMTMGVSTVAIGLLPTYHDIGLLAPALLCLCRLGQGLGLGGEWGGAVLLATENAPEGRRAWWGMFPQLGAPIGFFCSTLSFLALDWLLTDEQFFSFGWRIPFVASAALVVVGLYVRLRITETPAFREAAEKRELVRAPVASVFAEYSGTLALGVVAAIATFVIFYLMTVFTLSWGSTTLGYTRSQFLPLQMVGVVFFGLTIPLSALIADRIGPEAALIGASLAVMVFGFLFEPVFGSGTPAQVALFLSIGLGLMGFTYGPLSAALSELFPTSVRYTGSSMTFNLAGILGASPAPYAATWLASNYGLPAVGWYLSAMAALSAAAMWAILRRGRASTVRWG